MSDCIQVMLVRVNAFRIKRSFIVVLTEIESVIVLKDFAKVLIVHLLETRAAEERQVLHKFSQFVVKLGQTIILPNFLNLVKVQETVTVFILQIEVVQEL